MPNAYQMICRVQLWSYQGSADNEALSAGLLLDAAVAGLGTDAATSTEQSSGGEDFAWYLEKVPGALARLGVRKPGGVAFDLHQGTFDIDESALDVGVRYTVALAHTALGLLT